MLPAPIPGNEAERLAALRRYRILDTLPEQVYDDLTALAAHICRTPIALVSLVDSGRQWFKSHHGLEATETPRDVSFCGHAVASGSLLLVPDAHRDERFADNPLVTGAPHVRFYGGTPLTTHDGLALGTLCVIDTVPHQLSDEQLRMLEALGRQVVSQLELRLALDAADRAHQAKSAFLAGMSHELRTPLNSVIGFSTLVKKKWGDLIGETGVDYLMRIRRSGEHLLCLINDVLDASKIEAGRLELRFEPVDIMEIAREVVGQMESQAQNRGLALRLEGAEGLEPLEIDRLRLTQVLFNLLGNALKFTEEGEVVVRVVPAEDRPAVRHIEVQDTGIGIPEDELPNIFQAFRQVESGQSRRFGGTGLGLPIARSLCEMMGLSLSVESQVGRGSTFTVEVPVPSAAG